MKDVAAAAGVSMSTVSHVLNGTRKVHADTVRAVNEAIAAVGYSPNILARSLARSASSTIGVAIPALSNRYFAEVVHAIEAECIQHGLMMLFADTHDEPGQELRAVQALRQRQVDGILLATATDPDQQVLSYLKACKLPTVLVDRFSSADLDQVGAENVESTAQLVGHLVGHGHRRIGFIAGGDAMSTSDERVQGYRQALAEGGLTWDPTLVRSGESMMEPARRAVHELLALANPPTAIVAANNLMTIGAMSAMRDAGLQIPQDMALVGFDDFDWADYFEPRLTVMAQPIKDMGARAVKLLIRRLKTPTAKRQVVRLAPSLVVRRSCGCA